VDRQRHLALERQPRLAQFMAKAFLINGFQQPRPEQAVYLHGQTNDPVGQFTAGRIVVLHQPHTTVAGLMKR
jgi:hypothetical protein